MTGPVRTAFALLAVVGAGLLGYKIGRAHV